MQAVRHLPPQKKNTVSVQQIMPLQQSKYCVIRRATAAHAWPHPVEHSHLDALTGFLLPVAP